MSNNSKLVIMDSLSGEIVAEYEEPVKVKKFYVGPKKYWRIRMTYDKAQLAVPTKVGIQLLHHLKNYCNIANYTIYFTATELAKTFKCSSKSIKRAVDTLIKEGYLFRMSKSNYMINPDMFWIQDMKPEVWQALKQEYKDLHGMHFQSGKLTSDELTQLDAEITETLVGETDDE